MLRLAEQDKLTCLGVNLSRLDAVADYVASVTQERFPDLAIPPHSRWRHFEVGGIDRRPLYPPDAASRLELCIVSVLLDAGAGSRWRYQEPRTGLTLTRSEGLAVVSLHAFRAGIFSSDPSDPMRADAGGLQAASEKVLTSAFQAGPDNPIDGLAGRAALTCRLGQVLRDRKAERLTDLFRPLLESRSVAARDMLITLLETLAPIWPRPLGDVWPHPILRLVPFHKLSQWLSYSLIELLQAEGVTVTGQDALTGLPEYRNGGLFLDSGVLNLRDPDLAKTELPVDHPAIVEWRALTVALLDRLLPLVRFRLGPPAANLTMAQFLEGGTWEAGRRIARERRGDLSPPLRIRSDGSVF